MSISFSLGLKSRNRSRVTMLKRLIARIRYLSSARSVVLLLIFFSLTFFLAVEIIKKTRQPAVTWDVTLKPKGQPEVTEKLRVREVGHPDKNIDHVKPVHQSSSSKVTVKVPVREVGPTKNIDHVKPVHQSSSSKVTEKVPVREVGPTKNIDHVKPVHQSSSSKVTEKVSVREVGPTKNIDHVKPINQSSSLSSSSSNQTKSKSTDQEKYIIYVCDKTKYCYGLGDRQRAVSTLYILSLVTNRTFGIIWTQPCPVTQFLQPNEVNWDIPAWKLKGKTSIELEYLSRAKFLDLNTPFSQQFSQDIVYFRTNHNFLYGLRTSRYYAPRLPPWTRGPQLSVFGKAWKMLMKPTDLSRNNLNNMLVKIFQEQKMDEKITNSLGASKTCRDACESLRRFEEKMVKSNATKSGGDIFINETKFSKDKTVLGCVSELRKHQSPMLMKEHHNSNETNPNLVSWNNLNMFCKSDRFNKGKNDLINKSITADAIRKSRGYDQVDLNLVCIHARIGRSKGMPFDPARNSIESTKVLWDFVRPLIEQGRHLYIATDYDKVREDSEALFGLRSHSSSTPIVHMATIQKNQNETEGTALAMWEQLLLTTSCKTLIQSHSGFSMIAAAVSQRLPGKKTYHMFENGKVR